MRGIQSNKIQRNDSKAITEKILSCSEFAAYAEASMNAMSVL